MKNDRLQMFALQVRGLQASAMAFAQNAQVILDLLEVPSPELPESSSRDDSADECRHPSGQLQDARTMGYKTRFFCQVCRTMVDIVPRDQVATH